MATMKPTGGWILDKRIMIGNMYLSFGVFLDQNIIRVFMLAIFIIKGYDVCPPIMDRDRIVKLCTEFLTEVLLKIVYLY